MCVYQTSRRIQKHIEPTFEDGMFVLFVVVSKTGQASMWRYGVFLRRHKRQVLFKTFFSRLLVDFHRFLLMIPI